MILAKLGQSQPSFLQFDLVLKINHSLDIKGKWYRGKTCNKVITNRLNSSKLATAAYIKAKSMIVMEMA